MKKRIFVTHVVPKEQIETLNVSAAGNYFSYNLIDGKCFNVIYSLVPTNINKDIKDNSDVNYIQTRFFNNKNIFKLLNLVFDNYKLFSQVEKNSNLWYYNLTHQTILAFLLIKMFKPSVKQFVIVLDFTPPKRTVSLQNFIFKQINNSNGILSLTKNKQLSQKNLAVLPGIIPKDTTIKDQLQITNSFLLSGILSENRCPKLILEVFSKFPEFELIITGKIEDQTLVDSYISKYSNIKYLGFLKYEKYLEVLESTTFSINSRDPNFKENDFNFPSKTVEHLKHNKIIISTMEYSELDGINYFYVKPNVQDFCFFLNTLKEYNKKELLNTYANQSSKVTSLFGLSKWRETFTFLEQN
jgi:hypothetical protein